MDWMICASSLILTVGGLTTLAVKWRVDVRYGLTGGAGIGLVTAVLMHGIVRIAGNIHWFVLIGMEGLTILILTAIVIAFRFYRDPERRPPADDHLIVSPADGEILYIRKLEDGEIPVSEKKGHAMSISEMTQTDILDHGAWHIGIEMSILDVHVNRAPVEGKVVLQKHIPGLFLSLREWKAPYANERVVSVFDNGHFRIGTVQIASRLVRRILSYQKEGAWVMQGDRIGMIKFGSQVDLIIPDLEDFRIQVEQGDHVTAGTSVLCKYSETT